MAWKYASPSGTNPARQIPRPGTAGIYTTLATTQRTPTGPGIPTTKVGAYERPEQPLKPRSPLVMIGAVGLLAFLCWLLGIVA
jgi:hypothetical protein